MNIFPTTGDWLAKSVQEDYQARAKHYRLTRQFGDDPGRVPGFMQMLVVWRDEAVTWLSGDHQHHSPPPTLLRGGLS